MNTDTLLPVRLDPLKWLPTLVLALALSGCASAPSLIDRHFGLAVQRAQAQQTQPSPLRASSAPVADTDGVSADAAVARYQQSFQAPAALSPVINVGFGTPKAP
ncbi:hypothetical protein [Limnohabitans sp. Rim28]|uniref:hypothetical protein n=1 Tax=Limnohabitans sp. Rim28 TaxID=1100720 RepID=UPI000300AA27|nr:hypothetical protein [Limnohabitans sp. Rim28]PVE05589.1 hypothetical protein B472_14715 [Limnohabitans sp. Rim28]